jgi:hypothetical protein
MSVTPDTNFGMRDLTGPIERYGDWLNNFNNQVIALTPVLIGVSAGQATALDAMPAAWQAAFTLAIERATRTAVTVEALKDLRKTQVTAIRLIIRSIQGFAPKISVAWKKQLGINPGDDKRSIPPIPAQGPFLEIAGEFSRQLLVRYRNDITRKTSTRKPPGVRGVEVQWTSEDGRSGSTILSKTPCIIDFADDMAGQLVTLQGRWWLGQKRFSLHGPKETQAVPL